MMATRASRRRAALALVFALALDGCAGTTSDEESTLPVSLEEPAAPEPTPVVFVAEPPTPVGSSGTISRAELTPILDAGLGRFLGGVSTEPVVVDGRFVGFRVLAFYPNDPRFRTVDLRRGDVVTRVNGSSIERPEQALSVWNGLRVASELVVELRRGTETRELRYAIVE